MEVLGIDIGGSGIKGAPVNLEQGKLADERCRIETPDPATPEAVADVVGQIARHFKWTGAIGCTFPAVVMHGVVRTAANVDKSWIGTDGKQLLGESSGCEVTLLNDADAAAIAEMQFGAGRGVQGVVFLLTLGTGIGTAMFVNGILIPNLELGHLEYDGKEAEHQAAARVRTDEDLKWDAYAARIDRCLEVYENLFWPDLFIIGGGVSKKGEKYIPLLKRRTKIVAAETRNEAGIIGAALAAAGEGV